jgi:4-amino-4-deoxy-L-arabinose transferase-like glycosyltransferase
MVVTALSYAWGTAHQQPEIYYAAAVRSMASSWHDFFFAAVDPAGTVSIDKLPGALWLQALSVRLFGLHLWALNLPQIIERTLTVPVLFRVVRRVFDPVAALVAVLVYATTPATVALNRGNISDSLLILLLLCAMDAGSAAAMSGRVAPLIAAGVWVGLAFQAKMLQAWLIVPSLLLLWLLAAPRTLSRRLVAALAMLGVTAVVSLSWMVAVSVAPRADRPYVDGSRNNSVFEQVFVYNGFGRADTTKSSTAGAQTLRTLAESATLDADSRTDRSIAGAGGRAIGWLLPVAGVGLVAGLWGRRGRPRNDPVRAATLAFSLWLLIDLVAFSTVDTINAYYLAALAPPIAAVTGLAVTAGHRVAGSRRGRIGLAILAVIVVAYGSWLLAPAPTVFRIISPALAVVLCIVAVLTAAGSRARAGASVAAFLIAPALATGWLVAHRGDPFTTPFEPGSTRAVTQADVAASIKGAQAAMAAISAANSQATYAAAAYTSLLASPFIFATGKEILPIGGFSGTTPAPTLAELIQDIGTGRLHTVLVVPTHDARIVWIKANCLQVPTNNNQVVPYYCP